MIKINDKEFKEFEEKILWGTFSAVTNGQKRNGIAPRIMFCINNTLIGLELTFSKEMFENIELKTKTNIKRYISDVTYEDEKGWISIVDGQYNCDITRINDKDFQLEFHIIAHELDDIFDIFIEDIIEIL